MFYGAILYMGLVYSFVHEIINPHQMAFVGAIAVFLGTVPYVVQIELGDNLTSSVGPQMIVAGLIITSLPLILLMIVIGSPESRLYDIFSMGIAYEADSDISSKHRFSEAFTITSEK